MTTSTTAAEPEARSLAGDAKDWRRARKLVEDLASLRKQEEELGGELDAILVRLTGTEVGNTGHVVAAELGIPRTRILRAQRRNG